MSIREIISWPPVYMAPAIVAFFYKKRASSLLDIVLVNLLLGWTYVGWAFAWMLLIVDSRSFRPSGTSRPPDPATPGREPTAAAPEPCGSCGGAGSTTCQGCGGSRGYMERNEHAAYWVACQSCAGRGEQPCFGCNGTGKR